MITIRYQFKSDPVTEAQLLFGKEFLAQDPNRGMRITDGNGNVIYEAPLDEVICDSCNVTVAGVDPCAHVPDVGRLYCWTCAKEYVLPYRLADAEADRVSLFFAIRRTPDGKHAYPDLSTVDVDPARALDRAAPDDAKPVVAVAQFDHVTTHYL
jgi:hypothetical protein